MAVFDPLKTILPFYHTVSNDELIHIKHLYKIKNVKDFRCDLETFLKFYKPIHAEDLLKSIYENRPISNNSFLLSFDDGLSQVYDVIVPILKQMGIPAIFFINPDFINNKQLYYRFKASIVLEKVSTRKFSVADLRNIGISIGVKINSYSDFKKHILSINYLTKDKLDTLANEIGIDFNEFLKEIKPYLDETQIKQLVSEGFTIGAHSMGHPEYFNISHEFQILQTTQSISFVRQLSPKGARFFSFPYSDFGVSKKFFDEVFNEKNRLADLSFGTSGLKIDQCGWNLQRIPMEKYKYGAMEALCMQYSKYFAYSIIGKHLIKR